MKSILNILIVLSVVLSTTSGYAQIKNSKTETVKIFGNCDMCKSTIENAGNLKNLAIVHWDKDTKMADITFDSKKTNSDEILKRIALAGYDSDEFLAPDAVYNNLAECCKYVRQNKQATIVMEHSHTETEMTESIPENSMPAMENHTEMVLFETMETNPLDALFNSYFAVKDALVKTNAVTAATKSSELLATLNSITIESLKVEEQSVITKAMPSLMDAAKNISETKDIGKQREKFKVLSKKMHDIISLYNADETLYYQYCPMQDANWLSKEKAVKNPYYGSQMLSCGSVVETIKSKN